MKNKRIGAVTAGLLCLAAASAGPSWAIAGFGAGRSLDPKIALGEAREMEVPGGDRIIPAGYIPGAVLRPARGESHGVSILDLPLGTSLTVEVPSDYRFWTDNEYIHEKDCGKGYYQFITIFKYWIPTPPSPAPLFFLGEPIELVYRKSINMNGMGCSGVWGPRTCPFSSNYDDKETGPLQVVFYRKRNMENATWTTRREHIPVSEAQTIEEFAEAFKTCNPNQAHTLRIPGFAL